VAAEDRAIVVGINRYPALLRDLEGPENDARAFEEWLLSPTGGAVPKDHVRRILSSDFKKESDPRRAQPTAEKLKDAIDELHDLGTNNDGKAGQRLYIFMAGHGIAPKLRTAALLMANAARGRTGHHIQGPPYADWFVEAGFFKEVVLFMDCCRENSRLTPLQPCHLDERKAREPARYFYGLATQFGKAARERPGEDTLKRGIFTTALLVGLRQGPRGGGNVTGSWLRGFVFNYMNKLVAGPEKPQKPKFDYDPDDDIVFLTLDPPIFPVRIRAGSSGQGRKVTIRNKDFDEVPHSAYSDGLWQWELGPGFYQYGYSGGPWYDLPLDGEVQQYDVRL